MLKNAAYLLIVAFMLGSPGCALPVFDARTLPLLVTPEQVAAMKNILFVDVRPEEEFLARRIPEAVSLAARELSKTRGGVPLMLREPEELAELFAQRGLSRERAIVIYGSGEDARSVGAATRVFWALKHMRYPRVSLLDGGFRRWLAEDRPTVEGEPADTTGAAIEGAIKASTPAVPSPDSHLEATAAEVREAAFSGGRVIVDTRLEGQYLGQVPVRGVSRSGHIPGAVNIHYATLLQKPHMTFRPVSELRELLYPKGITQDSRIIVYCNAGNTSTVVWFAYLLLGHEEAANYDGSMFEWAADESFPVVRDDPVFDSER